MAVINTKGVKVYMSVGGTIPTQIDGPEITSISNENPALVTLVTADPTIMEGDLAYTTINETLDNRLYTIADVVAGEFALIGADASGLAAPVTVFPATNAISIIPAADMVLLCLSTMEFGADTVNQIPVGTFCDPAAQISGLATPGTITLGGYAEKDDPGVAEIQRAAEDQQPRFFQVVLPNDNGYIVGEISLAGFSLTIPLEGAVSWTVTGTQVKKIVWIHD